MQLARFARASILLCLVVSAVLLLSDGVALADGGPVAEAGGVPLSGVALVLSALNGIYTVTARQRFADREKLNALERRVSGMSEALKHVPKSDAIGELVGEVRSMRAKLEGVDTHIGNISRRFERYEQHMLEGGR